MIESLCQNQLSNGLSITPINIKGIIDIILSGSEYDWKINANIINITPSANNPPRFISLNVSACSSDRPANFQSKL